MHIKDYISVLMAKSDGRASSVQIEYFNGSIDWKLSLGNQLKFGVWFKSVSGIIYSIFYIRFCTNYNET